MAEDRPWKNKHHLTAQYAECGQAEARGLWPKTLLSTIGWDSTLELGICGERYLKCTTVV